MAKVKLSDREKKAQQAGGTLNYKTGKITVAKKPIPAQKQAIQNKISGYQALPKGISGPAAPKQILYNNAKKDYDQALGNIRKMVDVDNKVQSIKSTKAFKTASIKADADYYKKESEKAKVAAKPKNVVKEIASSIFRPKEALGKFTQEEANKTKPFFQIKVDNGKVTVPKFSGKTLKESLVGSARGAVGFGLDTAKLVKSGTDALVSRGTQGVDVFKGGVLKKAADVGGKIASVGNKADTFYKNPKTATEASYSQSSIGLANTLPVSRTKEGATLLRDAVEAAKRAGKDEVFIKRLVQGGEDAARSFLGSKAYATELPENVITREVTESGGDTSLTRENSQVLQTNRIEVPKTREELPKRNTGKEDEIFEELDQNTGRQKVYANVREGDGSLRKVEVGEFDETGNFKENLAEDGRPISEVLDESSRNLRSGKKGVTKGDASGGDSRAIVKQFGQSRRKEGLLQAARKKKRALTESEKAKRLEQNTKTDEKNYDRSLTASLIRQKADIQVRMRNADADEYLRLSDELESVDAKLSDLKKGSLTPEDKSFIGEESAKKGQDPVKIQQEGEKSGVLPQRKSLQFAAHGVGAGAGFEEGENGELRYDAEKGLLGLGAGVVGIKGAGKAKGILQAARERKVSMDILTTPVGKERGFSKSITQSPEVSMDLAKKASTYYEPRKTAPLIQNAQELIFKNPAEAERIALTQVDDNSVVVASELIKQYDTLAQQAKLAGNMAEHEALLEKAITVAAKTAENLTEQGRAIQAASVISKISPEGVLRWAMKEVNKFNKKTGQAGEDALKLDTKQADWFLEQARQIQRMPDNTDKAKAVYNLLNDINSLIPSSFGDKAAAVWKAGLLTGLKTSGVNIFSNVLHGGLEVAKDIPAAAIDSVASLFTGKRTKTATFKGLGSGTKEGFEKGWDYWKTGFDERNVGAKYDYKNVNFGKGKIAKAFQKYEETIFRTIGAEDQPFYYGAKARSLYDQAAADAKNKGLKGLPAKAHIQSFVKNPTDEAIKTSVLDAETATFTRQNKLGEVAKGISRPLGAAGEVIVPFKTTPANVFMQAINYSPVGVAKTIVENIGKGRWNQRQFSEGLARGLVGTGIFAVGGSLASKELMTLSAPTNERERNQWELEGKQPNSIYWNGAWRSAGSLGPVGITLLVGGYYQKALEETGSRTKALASAVAGLGKASVDQTFLRGVSGILEAVNDPLRKGSIFVENTAGSIIPTIVGDTARATDPLQREDSGVMERIQSRIPGLRNKLEPKVNTLGENVTRASGPLATMVDFFRSSKSKNENDPVVQEMIRLQELGLDGVPTELNEKQKVNGEDQQLEQGKLNELKRFVGQRIGRELKDMMSSQYYQGISDEEKGKVFNSLYQNALKAGKAQLLGSKESYQTEQYKEKDVEIRELHQRVTSLEKEGKLQEADDIVNELSDQDYDIYKKVQTAAKTAQTKAIKPKVEGLVEQVKTLDDQDRPDEADRLIADANLSDEEEDVLYRLLKQNKPKWEDIETLDEDLDEEELDELLADEE